MDLKVTGEQRLLNDFRDLSLANVGTGGIWKPVKFFEIGAFFKYEQEKEADGSHVNENRYYLEGTPKIWLGQLALSDRNRIEYRNKNTTDSWRYRNRLKLSYPIPVWKVQLSPYISEEIFYDTNPGKWNQNRLALGVSTRLTKNISISTYYLLKSKRKGRDWSEAHVLGTALSISV